MGEVEKMTLGQIAYEQMEHGHYPALRLAERELWEAVGHAVKAAVLAEQAGPTGMVEQERVNHPGHYNSHPLGLECIDVVEWLPFNVGNAIKYLWRHEYKDNSVEDLHKAIWYIQREIQRIELLAARHAQSGE